MSAAEPAETLQVAALATGVACGLVAGVFFAFSGFVLRALADLPAAQGVAAMQSINRAAVGPPLMLALFGTAVACVLVVGLAALGPGGGVARGLALAGVALYLVGTVGVTIAANVPLNDALAGLDPSAMDAPARWAAFLDAWTVRNHLRTVAAAGAAALLAAAGVVG